MARLVLVCLASIVVVTIAGPLQQREETNRRDKSPSSTSRRSDLLKPIGNCHEKDNAFKSGNTYEYKYFGKAETGLGFGDAQTVGLAMECKVRLAVPQPCEYRMKVSDCTAFEHDGSEDDDEDQDGHRTLEDEVKHLEQLAQVSRRGYKPSDRSEEMNRQVSEHDIQAQVADGEIARVVYKNEEDVWVVNFKKAILDALQVDIGLNSKAGAGEGLTMVNGIHGLCPTKFSEKSTSDNVIIEKDLDACIHAEKTNWELSPLSPIFNMSFVAKVMKAESVCSYKLERNSHIRTMTCRETHRFLALPWTNVAAATANVTQTLRFQRKESNADEMERSLADKTITTILYEHENVTDVDRKKGQGNADDILKDLVKKAIDGFDIDAPAKFDDFVDELRDSIDLDDVISVTRTLKDNEQEVAKHLLVQGLVQCNAPACLRALTNLMQADEIPRAVFEPIVMGLALTKQQDPMFLEEVKRICEIRPTRTCTLMVGALAYKLVDNDEDILEDPETAKPIKDAARFLGDLLEDDKCEPADKLDKADEDSDATKVIIALKAIGNLGHVAQKVQESSSRRTATKIEDKIAKCLADPSTPDNVTVAAIHAFRRFVPTREISEHLLRVLANEEESPHVRMAACMASVRMASDKQAVKKIVEVMEREKTQQVKAFMVSHLRQVLKSEDPNYKEVAEHIKDVLQEKGMKELPKLKARIPHSIHIELSKFYEVPFLDEEENDFGFQIEGVSMFSTKSYIPKSLQLNVSTQVFGDYMNVLETGVDLEGVENLVEKVLGPKGMLSKSKALRKARDTLSTIIQTIEELGYKHFRFEDVKEFTRKAFQLLQSKQYETVVDQVLSMLQDVDTSSLTQIFTHMRSMDADKIMETIRRSIPRTANLDKTIEKLKRIRYEQPTTETLVEVLEAFGITPEQSREIINQAKKYGVNVDKITEWIGRTDFQTIKEQLKHIHMDDIKEKYTTFVQKLQDLIDWFTEKYNLPNLRALVEMIKQTKEDPTEFRKHANTFLDSRRKDDEKTRKTKFYVDEDDSDDEDDDADDDDDDEMSENDHESLDRMPWGSQVKNFKRGQRDEDGDGKDDDEDIDITAFLRIFGNEIGFIQLSDITEFFDMEKFQQKIDLQTLRRVWEDILDGFDVQPTFAAKFEGVHHIATGLGLPLQLTLNITGITTCHMKLEPEGGSSLKKSVLEFEPSIAMQVATGMTIDLPSIHSIAVVTNTTVKSEFEFKMRLDLQKDSIDLEIQKPDEELDIMHFRHEVKLVKDDEDFSPFDDAKSHEVKKQKCLPDSVERITGLKICAELETSSLKGTPMIAHGPHELRVSVKESEQTGLKHVKLFGKRDQKDHENRFEVDFRAPDQRDEYPRQARATLVHNRQRNDVSLRAHSPQHTSPRLHVFVRVLNSEPDEYGVETGVDIELADDKHYNASVIYIKTGDMSYDKTIVDLVNDAEFNWTMGWSMQAPLIAVNFTTTTAKIEDTLLMEHNLTYRISPRLPFPALQKLHYPGAERRDDTSKFTLRHGLEFNADRISRDIQAFIQLLTFPHMEVAEPTIHHISQVKVHRDYRHIGLHANTTWLNEHDEIEFLNASATVENLFDILHLQERRDINLDFTVQTNDWRAALENELKMEAGQVKLTNEFNAKGMVPDCQTIFECTWKRVKAELRNVASVLRKPKTTATREHRHHLRPQRTRDEMVTLRERQMSVMVENRFGEKTMRNNQNGFWNQRTSREGQKAYQIQTHITAKMTGQPNKDMTAETFFGNDAKERNAILSWYVVHNATATNLPFGFDHFTHFLVNKEDGFVFSTSSSIDRNDQTFLGMSAEFQVDPKDMEVKASAKFDTPMIDGEGKVEVRKAGRGVEVRVTTKTEPESMPLLKHDLECSTTIALGKISQTLRLRHPKLDSEFKAEFDLFGGDDSGFDERDDDEDDDDEEQENTAGRAVSRKVVIERNRKIDREGSSNRAKSPSRKRLNNREDNRERRDTTARDGQEENDDEDDEQTNDRSRREPKGTTDRSRKISKYDNKFNRAGPRDPRVRTAQRPTDRRRDAESERDSSEDRESRTDSTAKYTFDSLKKRFGKIKPTMTCSLKVTSKDRERLPSFSIDTKMTPRHMKLDMEIRDVPRSMETLFTARRVTVQGDIENEKAAVKVVIDRGEAGAELALRGERKAEARIYDRNLVKSGETIHAQVTVELPTDDTVRAKIYLNPESGPKIARALTENTMTAFKASTQLAKEKTDQIWTMAKDMYTNPRHSVYEFIRSYYKGTIEQLVKDFMKTLREFRGTSMDGARSMYEDDSFFGTSPKEFLRKIDQERKKWMQYVMELLDKTPAGALIDAVPSIETIREEIEKIGNKHFPDQARVLQTHKRTFALETLESLDGLRRIQDFAVDLAKTFDPTRARELTDKAVRAMRDFLLDCVKGFKEKARRTEAGRKLTEVIDIPAIEEAIRKADVSTIDRIFETADTFKTVAQSMAGNRFKNVFQKEGEKMVITVPHPFEWRSLKELPSLTEDQRKRATTYLEKSKKAFRDVYDDDNVHVPMPDREEGFRFKWSDVKNLHKKNLPTQTAMIFGERHIMTFDGKVYSVPQSDKQCTYLMARGTRNENFALVKERNGITLTLPEMSITINEKNEVRLNNSRTTVQLPVESANKKATVKLVGDTVEVESRTGITLKCNGEQKICIVELSTGMWDESTGLLGTNDNEADNDWKMPTGKKASHAEEFVNAFELTKRTQCQLTRPGESQTSRRPGGRKCKESAKCETYFRSEDSKLSSCFETVEADEFFSACEEMTKECSNETIAQEVVCDIVEAYRKICDIRGVETEAPEECDTCDGRRQERSKWNIRGNQRKIDVVVMVSEHRDLEKDLETPAEKIRILMDTIARKLQQYKGQDVRAALVGFSGAGVHKDGHTHTLENKQFDSIHKLPQALKTLKFKGQEKTDVLEALDFVVESHEFRPEATKIILVFGPEERQFVSGGRHESVQEKLLDRGITVTVFAKYDELKERDLGINFDGEILSGKSKPETAKGEMPSRRASRLAKSTRGAVFKLDAVLGTNDATKKTQAADRAADIILEQMKREEILCKACVCQQNDFNQLISACKVSACA